MFARCGVVKFLGNNSMSIALFALFLACIAGQAASGWFAYDQSLQAAHFPGIGLTAYLRTGNFLDGSLSNWQAAILQLGVLIAFGAVLRQKGAAHSRKADTRSHRKLQWKFHPRETVGEWLYGNSLSLAFASMFVLCFAAHMIFGQWKYNEDQMMQHLPAMRFGAYVVSSSFWFSVFQCWEAEFAAMGIYIVLSIFLRQEGSSESKPVGSGDGQTGGTNE